MDMDSTSSSDVDMEINYKSADEKNIDDLCSQMSALTTNDPIESRLFKFLFKWQPNIAINHRSDMTIIWFNSKYYEQFRYAIKTFNDVCDTHVIYYTTNMQQSFYDCYVTLTIVKK